MLRCGWHALIILHLGPSHYAGLRCACMRWDVLHMLRCGWHALTFLHLDPPHYAGLRWGAAHAALCLHALGCPAHAALRPCLVLRSQALTSCISCSALFCPLATHLLYSALLCCCAQTLCCSSIRKFAITAVLTHLAGLLHRCPAALGTPSS
jgi:hypothetical protein